MASIFRSGDIVLYRPMLGSVMYAVIEYALAYVDILNMYKIRYEVGGEHYQLIVSGEELIKQYSHAQISGPDLS